MLHKYLTYDNPLLDKNDDNDVGQLELVKSGILEVLSLYVQKYDDAFGIHVQPFIKSTWNLLTAVGMETKYDILVSKALQFLTSVTRISEHARSFDDESIMEQVVERVILPNLALRDTDVELFEDEPIEFGGISKDQTMIPDGEPQQIFYGSCYLNSKRWWQR